MIPTCSVCGSMACLAQSPDVCRHTGKRRGQEAVADRPLPFEVPTAEALKELKEELLGMVGLDEPPKDKQVRRGRTVNQRQK